MLLKIEEQSSKKKRNKGIESMRKIALYEIVIIIEYIVWSNKRHYLSNLNAMTRMAVELLDGCQSNNNNKKNGKGFIQLVQLFIHPQMK